MKDTRKKHHDTDNDDDDDDDDKEMKSTLRRILLGHFTCGSAGHKIINIGHITCGRLEAPKAPTPTGWDVGRDVPLPRNFLDF